MNSIVEGVKNDWRGFAFERIGLAHVDQIKKALGIAGVRTEVYSWKCSASAELRGAQIDLLLVRADGIVNVCEMKYSKNEYVIEKAENERIANRVEAFRRVVGDRRILHVTLVTANGLAHNVYRNNVQAELTLDDLFAD